MAQPMTKNQFSILFTKIAVLLLFITLFMVETLKCWTINSLFIKVGNKN